jgi:hypothetical protein
MAFMQWCRIVKASLVLALVIPTSAWAQSSPNAKLIEAAKKEGEVIYYTTMTLDQSKSVADRFEKKYGAGAMIGILLSAGARWFCR